jgi:DNA-binding response OmpR family regulator
MKLKILVLGSKNIVRRVANSLVNTDIEIGYRQNISDAITAIKNEKFDLALVDSSLENLESACYRITWQCRIPVVLIIKGTSTDWKVLRSMDADGFIPEEANNMELMAYFTSIASRKNCHPVNARILIIEDDDQTQEALRLAFQIYWPEAIVSSATSGRDGVSAAHRESFDAILLDLKLPDITGHEVLNQIRIFSQAPVIIVTASGNHEDMIKCISSGANDYVFKPFNQLGLMSRIRHQVTIGTSVSKV